MIVTGARGRGLPSAVDEQINPGETRAPRPTSAQVLFRFGIRLVLVGLLATFSQRAYAESLAVLLILSVVFCAAVGVARREDIFGSGLTHWDEAAACAALGISVHMLA